MGVRTGTETSVYGAVSCKPHLIEKNMNFGLWTPNPPTFQTLPLPSPANPSSAPKNPLPSQLPLCSQSPPPYSILLPTPAGRTGLRRIHLPLANKSILGLRLLTSCWEELGPTPLPCLLKCLPAGSLSRLPQSWLPAIISGWFHTFFGHYTNLSQPDVH